jgi:hypothetical protein
MDVQLLDLDGAVSQQRRLRQLASRIIPLRGWGRRLRLACRWSSFRRFEVALARMLGGTRDATPTLRFLGSGDFHHVALALLGRLSRPCNLLVIDNHPDWMRGVPVLHCGTWLYHAARLPQVRRVFHVGGDVDFDNHYRLLAPWPLLRSGKITVLPAVRTFAGAGWNAIAHGPLRRRPTEPATPERVEELLSVWRDELATAPLYISLDRDVLRAGQAAINWDAGHLETAEVEAVIEAFARSSAGVAAMDVVGDWSDVAVAGMFRRLLHWVEHPNQQINAQEARARNEPFNLALAGLLTRTETPTTASAER